MVADEVRNLAQPLGQAAKETEELIADSTREGQHWFDARVEVFSTSIGWDHDLRGSGEGPRSNRSAVPAHAAVAGLSQVTQSIQQMERVT